jgi:hypothetical protein
MELTKHQQEIVLRELRQGSNLAKACEAADIQRRGDVLDQCERDDSFAGQYTRAREIGYALLGDDLLSVSDDTSIPADHRRIMVDSRKWMLSKMLPKVYGDRLNLEHSGSVSRADALTDEELQAVIDAKTPRQA